MQKNTGLIVTWWLKQNIWHYLWVPVLAAISLTELIVCGMSLLLLGRIDNGYLLTGSVAAGLVSLVVCAALFYLAGRLRKSEERYRLLVDKSPFCIYEMDTGGRLQSMNKAGLDILGLDDEKEICGVPYLDAVSEQDSVRVRALFQGALSGNTTLFEFAASGNTQRYFKSYLIPIKDAHGKVARLIGMTEDITKQKMLEGVLAESVERFTLIMETIDEVFWIADVPIENMLYISPGYERVWGRTAESLYENPRAFIEAVHPEDVERVLSDLEAEKTGQPFDHEYRVVRPDGTIRWVWDRGFPIRNKTGMVMRYAGVAQDITDRKQAERHLRDLTAHVQTVREEEKASIAREIHDDLGGALLTMKMATNWLKTELLENNKEATQLLDHVQEMSQAIDHSADIMRNIITGLRPPILIEIGLLAALEWQAMHFQNRTGIKCRVNCIGDKGDLDETRSIAMFRISQEALSNVARHSGASNVEIEFHHNNEEVVMSIIDNGRGMTDTHTDAAKHFGILGMRERVDQLNGMISFDTPPGGGFNVTVVLPLPAHDEKAAT